MRGRGGHDAAHCDGGEGWTAERRALGAGAIREAFEESGILLARDARDGGFVTAERLAELQHYRPLLDKREADIRYLKRLRSVAAAAEAVR